MLVASPSLHLFIAPASVGRLLRETHLIPKNPVRSERSQVAPGDSAADFRGVYGNPDA
jgi:hypothetical protein